MIHYQHADDKRTNIPTAVIAGQGSVPKAEKKRYWKEIPSEERSPWVNCIPLTSLKAAAGSWSREQASLEDAPDWAET